MDEQFQKVKEEVEKDPNIIGLILVGSRGKGFENENSDYDANVIAVDEYIEEVKKFFEDPLFTDIDIGVMSLSDFRHYGEWDTPEKWDRYDYAHTKILVDKTGEIQTIADEKGTIPKSVLKTYIRSALDTYINSVFRSVKAIRRGDLFDAQICAAESVIDLLTTIFAFEGRLRPFPQYTSHELKTYPLIDLPWETEEFISKVERILSTADLETQQEVLRKIEQVAREKGYGQAFDDWEGKDKWTMEFDPTTDTTASRNIR